MSNAPDRAKDLTPILIGALVALILAAFAAIVVVAILAPTAAPIVAPIVTVLGAVVPGIFALVQVQKVHAAVNGQAEILNAMTERNALKTGLEIGGRMDPADPASAARGQTEIRDVAAKNAATRKETLLAAGADPPAVKP